jgi:hypothetical protein
VDVVSGTPYDVALAAGVADRYLVSTCRIASPGAWTVGASGGPRPGADGTVDVACAVQPMESAARRGGEELEAGALGAEAAWRVYLPPGTPIDAQATLVWLDAVPAPRTFRVVRVDGQQTAEPVRRVVCVERS